MGSGMRENPNGERPSLRPGASDPNEPSDYDEDDEEALAASSGGFLDALQQQFGSAPWWVISTVIHVIILALLTLIVISITEKDDDDIIITTDLTKKKEEREKPKIRDVFKQVKEVDFETVVENPHFVHEKVEVTDHVETDNDMDLNTARGHEDAISDIPLGGPGVVGNNGVGGGGGGAYGFRTGGGRKKATTRFGGSRASESAVDAALQWLARNQEADGSWLISRHEGTYSDEKGHIAMTGLGLLAFLGAGHTEKAGKWRPVVQKAVNYLISKQSGEGGIQRGYNHAIAGLALAESFGMARVRRTGEAAQKAIDYTCDKHQKKYSAWRYSPQSEPDTSVTGWFIMQLKSAKVANLQVPGESFQGAINWLDKCEIKQGGDDQYSGGVFSYQPGRGSRPRITSVGMLGRLFMGWPPNQLQGGAQMLMGSLPTWGRKDFYYWYYGTLDMFQLGGDYWKAWNGAMRDMLINNQRKGGPEDGSWDPQGDNYAGAGRVWSTAVGALCLEVYYRYLPIYKK